MKLLCRKSIADGCRALRIDIPRSTTKASENANLLTCNKGFMHFLRVEGDCPLPKRSWEIPWDAVQVSFPDYSASNPHNGSTNWFYGEPEFYSSKEDTFSAGEVGKRIRSL